MKKSSLYEYYNDLIRNKDKSLDFYITNFLIKCFSMFEYSNLPNGLTAINLEKILQKNGYGIFTAYNDNFVFFDCGGVEEQDIYNEFKKFIVSKPQINLNKVYTNLNDCVLIKNNSLCQKTTNLIARYASLMVECDLSLNFAAVLTRLNVLISANDDFTKENADKYITNVINGQLGVIAENSFFDGVKMHNANINSNYISQLIELTQYIKASLYNEIGLNSNYNMKRERLSPDEVQTTHDILLPYVDNMLFERQTAVKQINELYNLNINVTLKNAWKQEKENNEKIIKNTDTETETETEIKNEIETNNEKNNINETE